ncbi:MAG: hypothetical protein J5529_00895 [Prevotella sp.]|nr:hypothetical protein [Prevotella sp.]
MTRLTLHKIACLAVTLLLSSFLAVNAQSQITQFKTFVYTSDELANDISKLNDERDTSRGYLGDLFTSAAGSMKGIASGYVTSFIDLGVTAIGSLVTRNARHRKEWEDVVKEENVYQTVINSVSEMSDFYDAPSFDGAMDPKGMRFDGIGCLRTEGSDTLFYISCHIDRSKLHRIINHSKFELVLDTLILSPTHSNLPNSKLGIPFSFEERKDFTLTMDITLSSSWMNEIVQLQKNQELGTFHINIPADQRVLDSKGFLRYVRPSNEPSRYQVTGESFIVPRSYSGFRDERDNFKDCWGTGEYKLTVSIKETCDVTDAYRSNWKNDYKHRKELAKKNKEEGLLEQSWEIISKQDWNEITRSWVITTLKAPASYISTDLINRLDLNNGK